MNYQDNGSSGSCSNKGVCPSDRQLLLRAKLQTGWSSSYKRVALNAEEQQAILSVIQRNEQLESVERERVSRLVERVERIKQRSSYYGPKNCSLCGQSFGFGLFLNMTHKHICMDCKKPVCSHCSLDIPSTSSPTKKNICLCHVCSEIRDIWKKSGAWFYKGLPNVESSQSRSNSGDEKSQTRDSMVQKKIPKMTKLGMEIDSDEEEDESECMKEEPTKITKNGSFSSGFLRNRNLFNLRLSTDFTASRLMINDNNPASASLPKKSPITPYSRQTSSSDSQKSANSLQQQPQMSESCWETGSGNSSSQRRRNSISSCYSITTDSMVGNENLTSNQSGNVPCLGWLEVSLSYDESRETVSCTILRARDLPAMDAQGLSDPFCKVNIITGDNTIRHSRWQKSRIAHRSINPEFNETFNFIGMNVEDAANSQLYIVILDDDKYGNDFLGATKVSLGMILNCGTCRMTCPLGAEDKFSMESLTTLHSNGQILIALCYNTQKRALIVVIKRCINLLAMDKNGLSDPFVKIQLRPDSGRKKFKTAIKWNSLNPVFNEEFSFQLPPNSLDKQTLIITVWDRDIGKSNDFLGSLVLGEQTSKGRRLKQWRDCLLLPDQYHEQWHSLGSQIPS